MPTGSQHLTKAKSNRQFLASIDRNTAADWAVVVAFYTAVHRIEQLRYHDDQANGPHSKSHDDRLYYIMQHHQYIYSAFANLYTLSRLARYDSNADFYAKLPNEDVDAKVIPLLVKVEQYVDGILP